jgi:hypothetical protein
VELRSEWNKKSERRKGQSKAEVRVGNRGTSVRVENCRGLLRETKRRE